MAPAPDPASDHEWLIVGEVSKPHGVHGDLMVAIRTDFPERLEDGVRFGLGPESGPESFHEVHRVRLHKGAWLLSVKDLRDRESVEGWRGRFIFLPEQALEELPEGYYYEHHLVGLEVRTPKGEPMGRITGVDPGFGQTRLVVRRERREFLVPYVPAIVTAVDIESGVVTVDAPPGLLDDEGEA